MEANTGIILAYLARDQSASSNNWLGYLRAELVRQESRPAGTAGTQKITAKLLDGEDKGKIVTLERYVAESADDSYRNIPKGSTILLYNADQKDPSYTYVDRYRVSSGLYLIALLVILVVVIARWRGVTAIAGLAVSVMVLVYFIFPRIAAGTDAFVACVQGAFIIATTSIFVAHGFSKRTATAFLGAIGTLLISVGLTLFSGRISALSGYVSDESVGFIYQGVTISLSSLLFGGIIIASLGVLNDITIGQAASVDEIYKADTKQSTLTLYKKGMSVGREHIAALVNTLALAYAGVALPSIIGLALYNNAPILVVLNSEFIMQEVVRTVVSSISLLIAVPLTTLLAAYILPRWYKRDKTKS